MKKIVMAIALTASTALLAQDVIGGLVGAAIGGAIGSQFGRGSGKTAATIGGAALGAMIGSDNDRGYSRPVTYAPSYPAPTVVYRDAPGIAYVQPQPRVVYVDAPRPVYYSYGYGEYGYRDRCDHWEHRRWHDERW